MNCSNSLRPKVVKTETEWRKQLTPEQYHVARGHGTERAFTGPYWNEKASGIYNWVCVCVWCVCVCACVCVRVCVCVCVRERVRKRERKREKWRKDNDHTV